MSNQLLITIGGASANGKSTLARSLHARFNDNAQKTMLIDSDLMRKVLWYSAQGESSFDEKVTLPVEAYSSEWGEKTYQAMYKNALFALRRGFHVIVDATFLSDEQRKRFEELATLQKAEHKGIWLENDQSALEQRADEREKGVSDATGFVVGLQFKKDFGDVSGWTKIRTDKTAADTLKKAIKALKI